MAAGLGALRDDDVDAGGHLAHGVLPRTDQGGTGNTGWPGAFQHRGGRHAERVGDQPDRVAESDVHQLLAGLELIGRRAVQVLPAWCPGSDRRRDGEADRGRRRGGCSGMLPRQVAQGGTRPGADRQVLGDQQIDAVRLAVDVGVDPGELGFKLLRRVACRARARRSRRTRLTAATTSRQWLNATKGNSIPSMRHSLVSITQTS